MEREEILYRYLRKELKPEEIALVEAWIKDSSENQRVFAEVKMMFLDLKALAYYENAEVTQTNRSWEKFEKEHKVKHMPKTNMSTFLKYAASILLAISVSIGIYYHQNRVETITVASAELVQEITLPDASYVSLNKDARLQYDEPFQNNERRIILKGEAYFEVSKAEGKPFVVEAGDVAVRVLGTRFFINQPSSHQMEVQVEEGKVLVSYKDSHQIINTGETIVVDLVNKELVETHDAVGINSFWKTKKLVFRLTSLEDAVDMLNKAYGASVRLEGPTAGCALTVTFENEELPDVLEIISSTLNYQLVEDKGTYILTGNGCQ